MSARLHATVVALLVLASLAGAVVAPLLTYGLTLATLGLAHVIAELRYVDARFGPALGRTLRRALGLLLGGVVVLRLLGLANLLPRAVLGPLELALVAALAACALPRLWRRGGGPLVVGVAAIVALAFAAAASPSHALLLLAVLHNLTPVGFVLERAPPHARSRALALCALLFVAVPLALVLWGPRAPLIDATLGSLGPLEHNLGAFLPPALRASEWAVPCFSAAVYLQCLHYVAVLHVLPRFDGPETWSPREAVLRWPRPLALALVTALASAPLLVAFALSFADARGAYGVAAAVHAWLEVPLLLIALSAVGPDR
jgi:hypothetical protein